VLGLKGRGDMEENVKKALATKDSTTQRRKSSFGLREFQGAREIYGNVRTHGALECRNSRHTRDSRPGLTTVAKVRAMQADEISPGKTVLQ